ncbi:MAG: hypothetical protein H6545_04245 [Bacteroidales bacterium]|jgi:hypothetical protein|nr:hypothetical protein [Bacteroidales bacterium]NLD64033.1 hypothetical protein [Bacteroidales bacterium]HOO66998.1 hypothetical protein [Bacteroidales bacterium]HPE21792.1 hypothetical protein [Bacteroidales bacterium]HPJ05535.1 hypothetical protein [Bacteroidales bacterium]
MKQLVLRNTLYERIYRSLGVVCLVMVIIIILTGDSGEWPFWVQIIAMLLLGLAFLSLNFGTLVNRLTADKGELIIRWYTRPGRVIIGIHEIEEIIADETSVRIILKSGRTIRLPTGMLEFNEKRAVRKFLKETTGF